MGHLDRRIDENSLFYTLAVEKGINEAPPSSTSKLLLLGRVRARYTKSPTAFIYDLQYLVGLSLPTRPRSLWLIYDYLVIDDDEYNFFQLETRQRCRLYREAAAILKGAWDLKWTVTDIGRFDLGQICEDVEKWKPKEGLLLKKVIESLAST